jgi:hypothetical protein
MEKRRGHPPRRMPLHRKKQIPRYARDDNWEAKLKLETRKQKIVSLFTNVSLIEQSCGCRSGILNVDKRRLL